MKPGTNPNKGVQEWRPLELMRDSNVTDFKCEDFIGIWENFVPESFCDQVVKWFDHISEGGGGSTVDPSDFEESFGPTNTDSASTTLMDGEMQYYSNMNRKDRSLLANYCNDGLTYQTNQYLKSCLKHYMSEFGQLKQVPMISTDIKVQRTCPGGGYHAWHYENSAASHAQREVVWMIYLNDLEEDGGGETEFMYQLKRIRPTKGTVVIFPAGYTHVHKGNMVLKGDKYILTGWYIKTHLN